MFIYGFIILILIVYYCDIYLLFLLYEFGSDLEDFQTFIDLILIIRFLQIKISLNSDFFSQSNFVPFLFARRSINIVISKIKIKRLIIDDDELLFFPYRIKLVKSLYIYRFLTYFYQATKLFFNDR